MALWLAVSAERERDRKKRTSSMPPAELSKVLLCIWQLHAHYGAVKKES
jgi:hypothetical protein